MSDMRLIYGNEKGMVLPLGLMFLAIIAILGTTAVVVTTTDLKIGSNYRASEQAFCAAEAGIEEARERLRGTSSILDNPDYAGDPATNPDATWSVYILTSSTWTTSDDPNYDSNYQNYIPTTTSHTATAITANSLQSNISYWVKIRHKTDAAGNILYWGDTDGDYDYEENDTANGEPIEIISSQGTDSGANKIVTIEARYEPAFFDPPAALYVNGNLAKNGAAGYAKGACPGCSPACTTMPDVVTTVNAGACPPKNCEASDWPAGTSTPPNLVDDETDIYPAAAVISQLSSKAENTIAPGSYTNPSGWGSAGSYEITYCNGDLEINGLTGYGILVIDGNFTAKGNIGWEGLIIVSGALILSGGGNLVVTGALISDSITEINGSVEIQYDCNVINDLDDTFSNYAVYSWKDFQ